MITNLRNDFNARWTPAKYNELQQKVAEKTRTQLEVRICETPIFVPADLMQTMIDAGTEMVHQLLNDKEYLAASDAAVPSEFRVPGPEGVPNFLQVDFGLVRDEQGNLAPKLVEMQSFPSVYGYQQVLAEQYVECYGLDRNLQQFLGGFDRESYWGLLRQIIVRDHDPRNVVLLEVEPKKQKTLMDFCLHEDRLGIRTVDIATVRRKGRRLEYPHKGKWIAIDRIYNRSIADEMVRKQIKPGFDLCEDFDVEWAGHPNWYFRISKFSLPYLRHSAVPACVFLDAWFRGEGHEKLPEDRERWVLKPLYSFSGKGIQFAPDEAALAAIPTEQRKDWLLQERMRFAPVIDTPEGMTQAEIRVMYLWPEGGQMTPCMSLVRLGRGTMMGVDHNRKQGWIGGSAGLVLPRQPSG